MVNYKLFYYKNLENLDVILVISVYCTGEEKIGEEKNFPSRQKFHIHFADGKWTGRRVPDDGELRD